MRVLVAVVEMDEKEANAVAATATAAALPLFVIDIYRLSRSPLPPRRATDHPSRAHHP